MRKLLSALVLLAVVAGPALAAAPVSISSARVFAPAQAGRTVAVVRPESGSEEADRALEAGLRAAGLTVAPPGESAALLVSYVVDVRRVFGVFPNGAHAGSVYVPASSVNDNYDRIATVVAWNAGSARPTPEAVAWITRLRSSGLSGDPAQFLPAMLRAGSPDYGRDRPRG